MFKVRRNRDEGSEKPQGARKNRDSGQSAPLKCFFRPSGPGSTKGSGGSAARGLRRPLPASWSPLPSAAPVPQASLAPAPHAWGGRLPCFWPGVLMHAELACQPLRHWTSCSPIWVENQRLASGPQPGPRHRIRPCRRDRETDVPVVLRCRALPAPLRPFSADVSLALRSP